MNVMPSNRSALYAAHLECKVPPSAVIRQDNLGKYTQIAWIIYKLWKTDDHFILKLCTLIKNVIESMHKFHYNILFTFLMGRGHASILMALAIWWYYSCLCTNFMSCYCILAENTKTAALWPSITFPVYESDHFSPPSEARRCGLADCCKPLCPQPDKYQLTSGSNL